jgi:drug/metabolite transporter (DMT)-like permease
MDRNLFKNPKSAIGIAIFCNILWGTAFPMVKIGYTLFQIGDDVGSKLLFAGIRFFLAGLILYTIHSFTTHTPAKIHRQNLIPVLLLVLLQTTLEYFFFYIGLSHATGTSSAIFSSISACYAVVLAHFFFTDDKLNAYKVIGCLLCLSGMFVSTLGEGGIHFQANGEGFLMISQLCFALGSVIGKKASRYDNPLVLTTYSLGFGGLCLIAGGLALGGSIPVVSPKALLVLLYLACLSATAFSLWNQVLKYHPVGKISIYTFLIPVTGTLVSGLALGEDILKVKYLISLFLVSYGIYTIYKKKESLGRKAEIVVLS